MARLGAPRMRSSRSRSVAGSRATFATSSDSSATKNGRRGEWLKVTLRVLKVPLDPHGAEDEPAGLYPRQVCREPIFHGPSARRIARGRFVVGPRQFRGLPCGIAHGKAQALVCGVGPEIHDPPTALVEVHLERVLFRVAIEPSLVALICRGVVEGGIRKLEDGRPRLGRLQDESDDECRNDHRRAAPPRGMIFLPAESTTTSQRLPPIHTFRSTSRFTLDGRIGANFGTTPFEANRRPV